MPPSTTDPVVPNNWPTTPDSKPPSWLEAPIKTFSTARTRPTHLGRRGQRDQRGADEHADGVGRRQAEHGDEGQRVRTGDTEDDGPHPEDGHRAEQDPPDPALDRANGDDQGHRPCPQAARRPQPAEAQRPGVQAYGDGRQKGHGPAEEHREQVKGDGAQDDRLGADKPQAFQRFVEAAPGGGYPVLEDVVHLVVTDRVERGRRPTCPAAWSGTRIARTAAAPAAERAAAATSGTQTPAP